MYDVMAGRYKGNASPTTHACIACASGQFQNTTGQLTCKNCGVGQYEPTTGKSECKPCAPNSFKVAASPTGCDPCSIGQYSEAGANSCLECDVTKDAVTGVDMSTVASVAHCIACQGKTPQDCTGAVCETAGICLGGVISTEGCTGVLTVFGHNTFNTATRKCSANCTGAYGFRVPDQPYCLGW